MQMTIRQLRAAIPCALGFVLVLTSALPALAGEGVLEINQTCASSVAGCFPGDAGSLPVSITQPGSYRLTSDLFQSADTEPVIHVLAEAVTIDLNGFSVVGPGVPELGGNGSAILGGHRVAVRNGFIRFASGAGVQIGGSSRVEDLHVHGSGRDGVQIAGEGTVRNVVATSNMGSGITAGAASMIEGCTATANGGHGISLPSGTVRGSTATQNTGAGGDFGAKVSYATNLFDQNAGGDVRGGHGSGGNVCGDGSCTSDGRRRYYLTRGVFWGFDASTACDAGFHVANFFEIRDPGALAYDRTRGAFSPGGATPPVGDSGWVMTGPSPSGATVPFVGNCQGYTSAATSADAGTVLGLSPSWATQALAPTSPWQATASFSCQSQWQVWCAED